MMLTVSGGHALLFESWADPGKTKYNAYEQTGPSTKHHVVPYPYWPKSRSGAWTYKPYRYNGLTP